MSKSVKELKKQKEFVDKVATWGSPIAYRCALKKYQEDLAQAVNERSLGI